MSIKVWSQEKSAILVEKASLERAIQESGLEKIKSNNRILELKSELDKAQSDLRKKAGEFENFKVAKQLF